MDDREADGPGGGFAPKDDTRRLTRAIVVLMVLMGLGLVLSLAGQFGQLLLDPSQPYRNWLAGGAVLGVAFVLAAMGWAEPVHRRSPLLWGVISVFGLGAGWFAWLGGTMTVNGMWTAGPVGKWEVAVERVVERTIVSRNTTREVRTAYFALPGGGTGEIDLPRDFPGAQPSTWTLSGEYVSGALGWPRWVRGTVTINGVPCH